MVVLVRYVFNEEDKAAILQPTVKYKYKCCIKDQNKRILGYFDEIQISSLNIDADNGLRRSISCTFYHISSIDNFLNLYMRMEFEFEIGVFSYRRNDYIWYPCGIFFINSASSTYDATTDTLSCTLGDRYSKCDGTINGQIGGAPTITISQKDADDNLVSVQNALRNFIKSENISDSLIITDIGEFYGQEDTNPDGYIKYREEHPEWNKLPYDLEFNAGDTQASMIEKIRDLYSNVEAYFDVYDNFCCNMIPSCTNDPVLLDNDYMQRIVLGEDTESVTYSVESIKNVTEVFGKYYQTDREAKSSALAVNGDLLGSKILTWSVSIDEYSEMSSCKMGIPLDNINYSDWYTKIEVKINNIQIDNKPVLLPLYKQYTKELVTAKNLIKGFNVIDIQKNSDGNWIAYYLGEYQPHAVCALTNDLNDNKYTKQYFVNKYNCDNVTLRLEDSPYAIQKIGEVLDVKSGDDFDNIYSNSVAKDNAVYHNQLSSSRNDTITLSTVLIPWLDVNIKVQYQRCNSDTPEEYIVKSISHDLDSMKSTLTLQKFYPLYFD